MDETQSAGGRGKPVRRRLAPVGLVAGGLVAGAILAGAGIAGAQSSGSGSTPAAPSNATTTTAARPDPAAMSHGPGETLLTGATASKVRQAALAAVPGATIIRVETDSAGAAYEAHLQKADGSFVTVKLDRSFTVTSTDAGFGGGPGGPPPSAA